MGVNRTQKGISLEAICATGRSIYKSRGAGGPSVTANLVVRVVSAVRIEDSELSVVENIECLGAEFERCSFAGVEVLQQSHVEVQSAWVIHEITPRVAECESLWGGKFIWIAQ